jgi:CDP-diacylglycerol--serine O-phosphatidyltransferase
MAIRDNRRFSKGIYILPNLFTTLNLFCGFYAIIKIIQSVSTNVVEFTHAGAAILVAAICDSIDGRIARLTKTTSLFGLEYDSLADLTSFCMAPALLLYTWGLVSFGQLGWLAAFLYFGCGALRLARFNAQANNKTKNHFLGLPTPMAAGLITTIIMIHPDLDTAVEPEKSYLIIVAYVIALLMVSNVRYPSFKQLNFSKQRSFSVMIILLTALIILAAKPILTLLVIFGGYAILGLLETFLSVKARTRLEQMITGTASEPDSNVKPPATKNDPSNL